MGKKYLALVLIYAAGCIGLSAQQPTLNELARLVAGEDTRNQVVSFVSGSRRERIPLLIELTTKSFSNVNDDGLQLGLAEIFGELTVEESVPFLVSHLTLSNGLAVFAPWLKTDDTVLRTFPCIQALVSIGPSASKALIKEYAGRGRDKSDERLAAIFVVAHIPGVPEAVEFLKGVSDPTVLERDYINKGLELQAR